MLAWIQEQLRTVRLGVDNVRAHKMRSVLTMLGIIFGVCSVISMLSIGAGANLEIQEQLNRLGSQNIIVQSIKPKQNPDEEAQAQAAGGFLLEYGLTYADAEFLNATLPALETIVPVKAQQSDLWVKGRKLTVQLVATVPWMEQNQVLNITEGRFISPMDIEQRRNVIVIGQDAARTLFRYEDPIDRQIQVDSDVYRVIGVVEPSGPMAGADSGGVDLASQSAGAYVPITTWRSRLGDSVVRQGQGGISAETVQLSELIMKVRNPEDVLETASLVDARLTRTHPDGDYKLTVPIKLLESRQRAQDIFTIVLSSIAAISLLVGGIGIMNIMLASVSERTREIGVRRALGARQRDIMAQFLVETLILSIGGGLLGMFLGAALPWIVTHYTDIATVLTPGAFILSFGVSAAVGLIFGLYPARRAALMDPIEALRHE